MYNTSHLRAYLKSNAANNAKFRRQTELLVNGFVHNETKKKCEDESILSLMCSCIGNLHMFNESSILSYDGKLQLQKLISSSLYHRNIPFTSTKMIFNSCIDGFSHNAFYTATSSYKNTLILIQNDADSQHSEPESNSENYYSSDDDYADAPKRETIFGAFTTKEWKIDNGHIEDKNAFLFRLTGNNHGSAVFPIKNYKEFALYQTQSPNDDEDAIFWFGQPASLVLSHNCNTNYKSYCFGGERSNYKMQYRGSMLGLMHSAHFRVRHFEVFHIV